MSEHSISTTLKKNPPPQHLYLRESLPKECAAVVLELKNRPSPRSPSFTTPVAVMNTLAGFISEKQKFWKFKSHNKVARKATALLIIDQKRLLFTLILTKFDCAVQKEWVWDLEFQINYFNSTNMESILKKTSKQTLTRKNTTKKPHTQRSIYRDFITTLYKLYIRTSIRTRKPLIMS